MVKTVLEYTRQVSDAAIQAKTGKSYQQWFTILDAVGAMQMHPPMYVQHLQSHLLHLLQ